jgi:hypothetical protein
MLQARQANRMFGAQATVAGLITFGFLLAGCQPGALPCDKDPEWQAICKGNADGGPMGGSGTGGSGTGGSGTGGASGTGGSGMPTAKTKDTVVPNCDKYKTLGGMDEFFAMRCGANAACHDAAGGNAWTNLKMPDIWDRLDDVPAKFACRGDMIIDTGAWEKSVLWRKTRPAPVMCAGPNMGMSTMPPPAIEPKMPVVTAEEDACLKSFLEVLAK